MVVYYLSRQGHWNWNSEQDNYDTCTLGLLTMLTIMTELEGCDDKGGGAGVWEWEQVW